MRPVPTSRGFAHPQPLLPQLHPCQPMTALPAFPGGSSPDPPTPRGRAGGYSPDLHHLPEVLAGQKDQGHPRTSSRVSIRHSEQSPPAVSNARPSFCDSETRSPEPAEDSRVTGGGFGDWCREAGSLDRLPRAGGALGLCRLVGEGLSDPLPASPWEAGHQPRPHRVPKEGLPPPTVSVLRVGAGPPPASRSSGPRVQSVPNMHSSVKRMGPAAALVPVSTSWLENADDAP